MLKWTLILGAVAIGLYFIFSSSQNSLTPAQLSALTPAQLLALTPTQIASLSPIQQAQLAALRSAPSNYATNPFTNPSPVSNNGSLLTAGVSTIGAAITAISNAFGGGTSVGGALPTSTGATTGPTYAQAGIQPDLPLTPVSPSLLVPLNGDPATIDSGGLVSAGIDYPGIQSYMIDPTAPDPNIAADPIGAVFT